MLYLCSQLFASWEIFHVFMSSSDFFENQLFRKIISGIPSECQTVWIHFRPDILSGLICVQTVCKGYQQMTLGSKELKLREIDPDLMSFIFQDYFTEQLERDSVTPLPKVVTNEFNAAERLVCLISESLFIVLNAATCIYR